MLVKKAETLYYIVKGSVAVLIKDEEGKEMILSYLNQGDFIGELGLFEEDQERTAWVRAKSPCEVAEISFKKFRQPYPSEPRYPDAFSKWQPLARTVRGAPASCSRRHYWSSRSRYLT